MTDEISFCNTCITVLEGYGDSVANLFEEICKNYVEGNCVTSRGLFTGRGHKVIRKLENLGYIVTVEVTKKTLLVKPLGLEKKIVEGKSISFICIHADNHM